MNKTDVRTIMQNYLKQHGYDGLVSVHDCFCFMDELLFCGKCQASCQPARAVYDAEKKFYLETAHGRRVCVKDKPGIFTDVRPEHVKRFTDPVLAELAKNHSWPTVRYEAVRRIRDQRLLADVIVELNTSLADAAFSRLTDQPMLTKIALTAPSYLSQRAIRKVDCPKLLAYLAATKMHAEPAELLSIHPDSGDMPLALLLCQTSATILFATKAIEWLDDVESLRYLLHFFYTKKTMFGQKLVARYLAATGCSNIDEEVAVMERRRVLVADLVRKSQSSSRERAYAESVEIIKQIDDQITLADIVIKVGIYLQAADIIKFTLERIHDSRVLTYLVRRSSDAGISTLERIDWQPALALFSCSNMTLQRRLAAIGRLHDQRWLQLVAWHSTEWQAFTEALSRINEPALLRELLDWGPHEKLFVAVSHRLNQLEEGKV